MKGVKHLFVQHTIMLLFVCRSFGCQSHSERISPIECEVRHPSQISTSLESMVEVLECQSCGEANRVLSPV
jgi:hypothetical protein